MQETLSAIAAPLTAWFRENKRELPWRSDRAPYHVWISEIMLQQTRIEAVMGYYDRFMRALPDVKSLSEIPEEQLLKLWEGLGYYSRARNLKKAAVKIMEEYGGAFPATYAQLLRLPGIGDYTAAAIASLCFNEKVPSVDGNVLRVVMRLLGRRDDVLLEKTKKDTAAMLREVMPDDAGDFNEGLMELGEVLCLPNGAPRCTVCPLQPYCAAYREDLTAELPVRIQKTKRRKEKKTVLVILTQDGRLALEKREKKGLLAGMYQLPNTAGYMKEEQIISLVKEWGLTPTEVTFLKDVKHVFTHIDWHMKGWLVRVETKNDAFIWASPEQLREQYPLPAAFQKML